MIIALAVILGVIFGYYEFVLKPLNAEIAFLQSDLKDKQSKIGRMQNKCWRNMMNSRRRSAAVLRELEWAQSRMPTFN
jgi:hypothetical protein